MVKELQSERIAIRFTPTEAEMLSELSETTGLSMTDVVRQAIRREYTEKIGAPEQTRKTKTKR